MGQLVTMGQLKTIIEVMKEIKSALGIEVCIEILKLVSSQLRRFLSLLFLSQKCERREVRICKNTQKLNIDF